MTEGQLSLDLALYLQDLQDSRQYVSDPILAFLGHKVGDAESYGIDVGVVYAPRSVEGLTLRLAGNWNSSEGPIPGLKLKRSPASVMAIACRWCRSGHWRWAQIIPGRP